MVSRKNSEMRFDLSNQYRPWSSTERVEVVHIHIVPPSVVVPTSRNLLNSAGPKREINGFTPLFSFFLTEEPKISVK